MNPDSITKLTAGLFDGIKNMKSVKNYSYDKSNDLVSAKDMINAKYHKMNQVKSIRLLYIGAPNRKEKILWRKRNL